MWCVPGLAALRERKASGGAPLPNAPAPCYGEVAPSRAPFGSPPGRAAGFASRTRLARAAVARRHLHGEQREGDVAGVLTGRRLRPLAAVASATRWAGVAVALIRPNTALV